MAVFVARPKAADVILSFIESAYHLNDILHFLALISSNLINRVPDVTKTSFARLVTVGGHFRTSSIFVFWPFSREKNWHKLRKVH